MNVLVVGGAGYIGSHMVRALRRATHQVVVLDDLSSGHRDAIGDAELIVGDVGVPDVADAALAARRFDAVMHFASRIRVDESVSEPARYYHTNVAATLVLLDAMRRHDVRQFVFSSSAAVYGNPLSTPITEDHPHQPTSPYGRSKSIVEAILGDYGAAYGLRHVSMRYFNAAGADPAGGLGERHEPETHLVPIVLQVASGRRSALTVHGTDWPTPDGTCVRDFVHVNDLCAAHLLALDHLAAGGACGAYNLGSEHGHSIREVVAAVERVTGRRVDVSGGARRPGDPAVLVASSARAKRELGWAPSRSALCDIVADAWAWERAR